MNVLCNKLGATTPSINHIHGNLPRIPGRSIVAGLLMLMSGCGREQGLKLEHYTLLATYPSGVTEEAPQNKVREFSIERDELGESHLLLRNGRLSLPIPDKLKDNGKLTVRCIIPSEHGGGVWVGGNIGDCGMVWHIRGNDITPYTIGEIAYQTHRDVQNGSQRLLHFPHVTGMMEVNGNLIVFCDETGSSRLPIGEATFRIGKDAK